MKITLIGGGNMAAAFIGGLSRRGFSMAAIEVVEPEAVLRDKLTETFGVRCAPSVDAAALDCEVFILAVKPQAVRAAVAPLLGKLRGQLVISIAAGLRIADLTRFLGGHTRIARAMPNTPALINAGITGCCAPNVDFEGRTMTGEILAAIGQVVWFDDERELDAVTAVSGSGPAYVFYFLEALTDAGVALGLAAQTARTLAVETFVGAAQLAHDATDGNDPPAPLPLAVLRERVTSKGGTTAAALECFAADQIQAAIQRGVRAAYERSQQLGDELGQQG